MEPEDLRPRLSLVLEHDGRPIVDEVLAGLLLLVERSGSIRGAAQSLGLSYSRAWERIQRAETVLRGRLVEARRGGPGGGGARLTMLGRRVLAWYVQHYRRLVGAPFEPPARAGHGTMGEVPVLAGSHDLLLERAVARRGGWLVEWTGSRAGALAVLLGEAGAAGVHVAGPGGYNVGLYRSLGLEGVAVLVRGYERSIGLACRMPCPPPGRAARLLLEGRLRLANRQPGSGSRELLERLLAGVEPRREAWERIPGWDREHRTHTGVAEAIARGEADIGIAIEAAARLYGLHYRRLAWERYDLIVSRSLLAPAMSLLEAARGLAGELPGYRVPRDSGKILEG